MGYCGNQQRYTRNTQLSTLSDLLLSYPGQIKNDTCTYTLKKIPNVKAIGQDRLLRGVTIVCFFTR